MRSTMVALSGVILMFFLAARVIPNLGLFQGYYFYVVLALFSSWLPKKMQLFWIAMIELQVGVRLMFFDWWLYMQSINSMLTSALEVPMLSDLELMIYGTIGLSYVFVSRLLLYYLVKRTLGRKLRDRLPNIYNMKD